MKPRKPMKRSEIHRVTPIRRTGMPRSGPVKPRRQTVSPAERQARKDMKTRSEGRCEIQVPDVCLGPGMVWSHRKRRSQSNLAEMWALSNGLHGCAFCEQYLTDNDTSARVRSFGWTVHSTLDPAAVPVFRCGEFVWLRDNGALIPLDLQEIAMWVAA